MQGGTYTAAAQAIRDGVPVDDLPISSAERLLLRLWLDPYEHRPAVSEVAERSRLVDLWYGKAA